MSTLANSEDPDEMLNNALLAKTKSLKERNTFFLFILF